jgi:muramidase (phage lysozyme)
VNSKALILGTAALAAVLLWPRTARASANIIDDSGDDVSGGFELDIPVTEGYSAPLLDLSGIDWLQDEPPMTALATPDENVRAFLYMIRSCEHLARDVESGADYSTFFGGGRFTNYADHPVNTGELRGVPLKPEWCRAAGFPGGKCVSTAAGAYQFTRPTWNELRAAGAWGRRLPDFSPASQDEAARRLLQRIGALPQIERGDVEEAIITASSRWASLPGSTSGQPQKKMSFALAKFNDGMRFA